MQHAHRIATLAAIALSGVWALVPGVAAADDDRDVRRLDGRSSGIEVDTPLGGARWRWVVDVNGPLSPLGQVSVHSAGELTLSGSLLTDWTGTTTIRAANGDEVRGTVRRGRGWVQPTLDERFMVTFVLIGGTGRFEHARGTLRVRGAGTFLGVDPAAGGLRYHQSATARGRLAWDDDDAP